MGTDIHLVAERLRQLLPDPVVDCEDWLHDKGTGKDGQCYWCKGTGKHSRPWYDNRNYDAFALLADVRNGSGFGGIDTGDGFIPIAEPRGLPMDMSRELVNATQSVINDDGETRLWLGDHDVSWVLASEVLALDWKRAHTRKRGWVSPEQFVVWQKEGAPKHWCGGVSGGDVQHISNWEMAQGIERGSIKFSGPTAKHPALQFSKVYTQVQWTATYDDAASDLREAVETLVALYGPADRLRLVFGFDS